jgi:hypothetical protein
VDTLPDDGPVFLKKYADYIAGSASIPDTWRQASEPFSKIEEDPNHGWFREQFSFMTEVPRSRYEFVLALYRENLRIETSDPENAHRMNVRWTGMPPRRFMATSSQTCDICAKGGPRAKTPPSWNRPARSMWPGWGITSETDHNRCTTRCITMAGMG